MRIQSLLPFVFGLLLLPLANGCATKALWENDNLEAWNEPAPAPNIRIFASATRGDMLVVYDEYSERNSSTHTRAYWLNENEKLLEQRRTPRFISTNSIFSLTPIPVLLITTNPVDFPSPPYAKVEFDQKSFTLFLRHGQAGPYNLPIYNDGKGKLEKLALTPLANLADLTLLGGMFGYSYLQGKSAGYNESY
jgi:hypothetical protein